MKKLLIVLFLTRIIADSSAQMPAHTPDNIKKYKSVCRENIYREMKGMYREPGGALNIHSWHREAVNISICYGIGTPG